MRKIFIISITLLLGCVSANAISRKALANYAYTLEGKKGAELKDAVYRLTTAMTVLDYGSGDNSTWYGFYTTDRIPETNECIDRYSNETWYFKSQGSTISGMNIEHSFPKSWWDGAKNNAYKDLYNLMPCESTINSSKSNYGMGVVIETNCTDNGCTKVGESDYGFDVWEPADKWKGDFARGYMYMATAHQNLCTKYTSQGLNSLDQNEYPTLQKWAYELYLSWGKTDKVTQLEVDRNNAVCAIQGNRNLFVDYPTLADYVWGDSVNVAFDPYTALTTCDDDLRYEEYDPSAIPVTPVDDEVNILDINFLTTQSDFIIENTEAPDFDVWTRDTRYGMKATAYNSTTKERYQSDSWLVSPVIDATNFSSLKLTFSHTGNYFNYNMPAYCSLWVKTEGGQWQEQTINTYPAGSNWAYVENENDISAFAGQNIQVAFRYTSTSEVAGTWEINALSLKGIRCSTGIEDPSSNGLHLSSNTQLYNLSGQRVDTSYHGVVIREGRKFFHNGK